MPASKSQEKLKKYRFLNNYYSITFGVGSCLKFYTVSQMIKAAG
jgi:hypothetical protein